MCLTPLVNVHSRFQLVKPCITLGNALSRRFLTSRLPPPGYANYLPRGTKLRFSKLKLTSQNLSSISHSFWAHRHFKPISTSFGKIPTTQFTAFYEKYAKDHVLLVRVGSFYEIYGHQAEKWGPILNLKLTKKGFCGFPEQVLLDYVNKLVQGHKQRVLVIEQTKDTKNLKNNYFSVPFLTNSGEIASKGMTRYLSRMYSPGTLPKEQDELTYLVALYVHQKDENRIFSQDRVTMTFCDLGSYDTNFIETDILNLQSHLSTVSPVELLCSKNQLDQKVNLNGNDILFSDYIKGNFLLTPLAPEVFSPMPHSNNTPYTSGCNFTFNALAHYLELAYAGSPPILSTTSSISDAHALIDKQTSNHLELFKSAARGAAKGSLFNCIDKTITKGGKKLLKRDLHFPSFQFDSINKRLLCLRLLCANSEIPSDIALHLKTLQASTPLEELCTKLQSSTIELKDIKEFLQWFKFMDSMNSRLNSFVEFQLTCENLSGYTKIISFIESKINFEKPDSPSLQHGISVDYDTAFSNIQSLSKEIQEFKFHFRSKYGFTKQTKMPEFVGIKDQSSVPFIELTPPQYRSILKANDSDISLVSDHESHVKISHKVRRRLLTEFLTWTMIQNKFVECEAFILKVEKRVCKAVAEKLGDILQKMINSTREISKLDVFQSHFHTVQKYGLMEPSFDLTKRTFSVKNGFHPVLLDAVVERGVYPVSNDVTFSPEKPLCIITGPNMGGKSTYLRQIGLTAILAQIGCFVPAQSACLPIFKSIYTRFGSYDDLQNNLSSFMSEVTELSRVFERASSDSLVLLDELGRGTSHLDGLSLFLAVVKLMLKNNMYACLTTHYRNIDKLLLKVLEPCSVQRIRFLKSDLICEKDNTGNETMRVDYKFQEGIAAHSYGLEIAGWSKLSSELLDTAKEIRDIIKQDILV